MMMKIKKIFLNQHQYFWLILAILLICILVLQIVAAQIRSFWEDEAYTAWLITRNLPVLVQNLKADVNSNPPLYWLLVFFWSKAFGTSELGIRSFSILWMTATCLLTYKLARDMFDERTALTAVILLTFSPLVLTYGHNARYYSMAAALALLLILMMLNYINTGRSLFLAFYVLVGTGLLYTIYMGATILFALNLWWFFQWIKKSRNVTALIMWAFAQVVILLFYAPWISIVVSTLQRNLPSEISVSNWLKEIILRVGYLGYAFGVGEFISPLNPISWFGILLTIGLVFWGLLRGKQAIWLPLTVLLVEGILSIGFNIIARFPQSIWQNLSSRSFFIYPLFAIILAIGITQLKRKWRAGSMLGILLVYVFGIVNFFTGREAIKPILIVPWRTIMGVIQKNSNADAVVICTNDFACSYYQAIYGFAALSPASWEQLSAQKPSEIWWIQSNISNDSNLPDGDSKTFSSIQSQYQESGVFNYAAQDNSIAMIKSRFLGYQSYQYRVVVHRFDLP